MDPMKLRGSARLDDHETIFFGRELEHVMARVFEAEYPELKATRLIPVSTEAGPGAEVVTYRMFDKVGMAKVVASYATDFPRVDIFGKEFNAGVKSIGDSYGWGIQEIRAARMANRPLESMKALSARHAFDVLVDELAWNGSQNNNIQGFLTHPNIPSSLVDDGAGNDTRWCPVAGVTTKTPDEIIEDVNRLLNEIKSTTRGVHQADTVLIPTDEYAHIASTPRSATSDTTILEFLRKVHPGVTFEELERLADVSPEIVGGGDSTNVMIAYARRPEILQLHIPQPFEQFDPQQNGMEYVVYCHGRCAGTIIYKPLACNILEGI